LIIQFLKKLFLKEEISEKAIIHSSKGEYTNTNRLKSGGHGQEAIDYMNDHNIKYNIQKTYKNGVRTGNVPNHVNKKNQQDNHHSWFPKNWDRKEIKKAGQTIAKKSYKNKSRSTGKYKNVLVTIIRNNGKIETIFPNSNQTRTKKQIKGDT
jgi:hypothetical protein